MRLLLTSAGITNDSIRRALVELLGKPISECKAAYVPTATYATPGGPGYVWQGLKQMADLGWAEIAVLELTALPTLLEEHWLPDLQAANVIIVQGGNSGYLSYWFYQSGLAKRLPKLLKDKVYFGVSAGSAMVTQGLNVDRAVLRKSGIYYDDEYDEAAPPGAGSNKTLKLVPFVVRPHLGADYFPAATLDLFARAAAKVKVPLYAIDDQTALKVVDDRVEVVSEGEWKLFNK